MIFNTMKYARPTMQKVVVNFVNNVVAARNLDLSMEKTVAELLWGFESEAVSICKSSPILRNIMGK